MGVWWWITKGHNYWAEKGVITPPIKLPFGNNPTLNNDIILSRKNVCTIAKEQFELLDRPKCYGTYVLNQPILMVCDPEMVKQIFVKDFNNFIDRQSKNAKSLFNEETLTDKIWLEMMIFLDGEHWKDVRGTFSPIFTSGKMKGMFSLIQETSKLLNKSFEDELRNGNSAELELKDKFGRFSMDTIASCAFGIDAKSFSKTGESDFVINARNIFRRSIDDNIKLPIAIIPYLGPKLMKLFKIAVFKSKETMFFYTVLKSAINQRVEGKVEKRNDLIDLMLEAIKETQTDEENSNITDNKEASLTEQIEEDSKLNHKRKKQIEEINLIATALVMFVAGYDTTAQTLSFVGYELAKNPEIQDKLCEEIDAVVEQTGGELPSYNQIQGMQYLDMVIHEALRKWPIVGVITRGVERDCVIPGTNIDVKKNMEIHVNVPAIHHNPENFPDPQVFDPERFNKENSAKRHP